MRFTGERVVEGCTPGRIWADHVARYQFATQFVSGKRVLDAGCGTGYGSRMLATAGAQAVVGVDNSLSTVRFAQRRYGHDSVAYVVADLEHLCFRRCSFDVVTCFEAIEHVRSPIQVLRELSTVLTSGGILVVSTPNRTLTSPGKRLEEPPNNPFHVMEYTPSEFLEMVGTLYRVESVLGQRGRPCTSLGIHDPAAGQSSLEAVLEDNIYRYVTVVCRSVV